MSSSRIIRHGGEPQRNYALEPLGAELPKLEQAGFRPVSLGGEEPGVEPEQEPELPPCIPEEEALRRIREAHADGVREGEQAAQASLSSVSEALGQALLATGSLRSRLLNESEDDLLKLAVLIARSIMLREVSCNPSILASIVRETVELAVDGAEIVVRLNPDDHALIAQRPEFADLSGDRRRVTMKPDPSLPKAGCLVETSRGNIDAGVESQLDEIYRRLCEEKCALRSEKEHAGD